MQFFQWDENDLIHWGRVTHICVSKLTSISSDNGLSPGRRQDTIWTNDGIFSIEPLGENFSEILIEIHTFSFKKMHLKMSSGEWRPFCLGLNVLTRRQIKFCFAHSSVSYMNNNNLNVAEQCIKGRGSDRRLVLLGGGVTWFEHGM